MGQRIEVAATVVDDIAMFNTDRAITGQDGAGFGVADASDSNTFDGQLAAKLFDGVSGIDHVFVASNQVVVRRPHGWDDHSVAAASGVISDFFLFYEA